VRQNIKDALLSRYNDYLEVPKDGEVRDKMANNRANRGKSAGKKEEPLPPNTARCQFCGRVDKNFFSEIKLDMHYWRECPMLTTCPQCQQVAQIVDLTKHLLSECSASRCQQCPRCKMAILKEEYNDHLKRFACTPAKNPSEAMRCPLCAQDVPPKPEDWNQHIMTQGCPNNERTIS